MRILITSDNHLGYKEASPELCEDSYRTFEEILRTASSERVDLILQGGDLFHDNRPSRNCLNRAVGLLKRYCIGSERSGLRACPSLNSADRNINVSIPVVAIHGNHDDPSGINMVSPIDILHSSGLVNYIGKSENVDRIDVHPLLIEGDCRVAIYGLGHVKDRRLYRTFLEGRVTFHKPRDHGRWFNILVVHQNRVPREKEHLPESFIDEFFDLVIYGHEHESMVVKDRFLTLQPGSTVRTSLCEMESRDKYVYILNLCGSPVLEHVRLKTLRLFRLCSMKVEDENSAEDRARQRIEEMVEETRRDHLVKREEINRTIIDVDAERFRCGEFKVVERRAESHSGDVEMLSPLIRLRIEAGRNVVLNKHRLAAQFKDVVANPAEMLSVSRRTKRSEEPNFHPQTEKVEISQILGRILRDVEFGALTGDRFSESLNEFVFKGDKNAFIEMVRKSAKEVVDKIDYSSAGGDIERAIRNAVREMHGAEEAPGENGGALDENEPKNAPASCAKRFFELNSFKTESRMSVHSSQPERLSDVPAEEEPKKIKKSDESSADLSFSFSKYL